MEQIATAWREAWTGAMYRRLIQVSIALFALGVLSIWNPLHVHVVRQFGAFWVLAAGTGGSFVATLACLLAVSMIRKQTLRMLCLVAVVIGGAFALFLSAGVALFANTSKQVQRHTAPHLVIAVEQNDGFLDRCYTVEYRWGAIEQFKEVTHCLAEEPKVNVDPTARIVTINACTFTVDRLHHRLNASTSKCKAELVDGPDEHWQFD